MCNNTVYPERKNGTFLDNLFKKNIFAKMPIQYSTVEDFVRHTLLNLLMPFKLKSLYSIPQWLRDLKFENPIKANIFR